MAARTTTLANIRNEMGHWIYLVIPMVLFVVFFIVPIIWTIWLSLHNWDGISRNMRFIGGANYSRCLPSPASSTLSQTTLPGLPSICWRRVASDSCSR